MLRLAQQIGGRQPGIRLFIGDHQHLGGAGHHVDVQLAVGHAFGGGHVGVARPHQLVHPGDEARPIGQGGHRLGPAHGNHTIHAGNFCGGQHRVVQVLRGGRNHDNLPHPRHLGGDGVHQHRGGVGRRAAGHIDAHPAQAPDDTAHHAPVGGAPLLALEQQLFIVVPDVGRRPLQGREQFWRAGRAGRLQPLRRNLIGLRPVEFPGAGRHRRVAVLPHVL